MIFKKHKFLVLHNDAFLQKILTKNENSVIMRP